MLKLKLSVILLLITTTFFFVPSVLADNSSQFPHQIQRLSNQQQRFILFILSNIDIVNDEITNQRAELLDAYKDFKDGKSLGPFDYAWLSELAFEYKVDNPDFTQPSTWLTLLNRVDIIPSSLVIAQAINESAWGTSRFAVEGNNYFGQWCYSPGCGLIPRDRRSGIIYEVQRYSDSLSSVWGYVNNLNTFDAYQDFRARRALLRREGRPVIGLDLIGTLSSYSEVRGEYIKRIIGIITSLNLTQYDIKDLPDSVRAGLGHRGA